MPITTDTPATRNALARLNDDVLNSMDNEGNCTVKVSDLSTLLAAYKIELNKARSLKKSLSETSEV
ncbi:hypothetical protein RN22_18750 [Grimontia sp. AD028]|uniref:Uncharacterized protein n=1 Tax=Grimontia sedimenti TaxID=2711294 RepID=A0A6M1RQN9_9GAMM|nr:MULTISPECIES: hypothetical protein [Grimontia]KKD58909.1 hypothetical protein RN22_18750 [Grimontia sp. AD028]NGN98357.1 hypothetical protein [Grimontia sedimenti]